MIDNLETSAIVDGFLRARIQQEGLEWPGSTTSTRDVKVGDKIDALLRTTRLFERENQSELNNMLEQCNVAHDDLIDQFDQIATAFSSSSDQSNTFGYGRLVSILSFSALLMMKCARSRRMNQLELLRIRTETMLQLLIGKNWTKKNHFSWDGFVQWSNRRCGEEKFSMIAMAMGAILIGVLAVYTAKRFLNI